MIQNIQTAIEEAKNIFAEYKQSESNYFTFQSWKSLEEVTRAAPTLRQAMYREIASKIPQVTDEDLNPSELDLMSEFEITYYQGLESLASKISESLQSDPVLSLGELLFAGSFIMTAIDMVDTYMTQPDTEALQKSFKIFYIHAMCRITDYFASNKHKKPEVIESHIKRFFTNLYGEHYYDQMFLEMYSPV